MPRLPPPCAPCLRVEASAEGGSEGLGAAPPAAASAAAPPKAPPSIADILSAESPAAAVEAARNLWKAAVEDKDPAAQAGLLGLVPFV